MYQASFWHDVWLGEIILYLLLVSWLGRGGNKEEEMVIQLSELWRRRRGRRRRTRFMLF